MTEVVSPSDVLQSLGINVKLLFAQFVNFAIIMIVVWKWVYRPLLKAMDSRSKKISDGLAHAEEAAKKLHDAEERQNALLQEAREKARHMIRAAHEQAEQDRQELLTKSQAEVERHIKEAKARLEQEERAMLQAVKAQSADLIIRALEKIMPSFVDARSAEHLTREALVELERQRL